MKDEKTRSKVQDIIWRIMTELLPILSDMNVPYFMLAGTLLGAVRHKGFIPWDDDIDIGIPRTDYERFLREIPSRLPAHLELNTYRDNSPHHYYFSRIVDTRHTLKRTGSMEERSEPVWVDIFPLDGMPNHVVARHLHMLGLLYTRLRYHMATINKVNLKRPGRPLYARLIIRLTLLTGIGTRTSPRKWLDKMDALLKKYPPETSDWIINFMGQYLYRELCPKAWYGTGTLYDFEDEKMAGPDQYDPVLKRLYGNYMTPAKSRNAHATVFEG